MHSNYLSTNHRDYRKLTPVPFVTTFVMTQPKVKKLIYKSHTLGFRAKRKITISGNSALCSNFLQLIQSLTSP